MSKSFRFTHCTATVETLADHEYIAAASIMISACEYVSWWQLDMTLEGKQSLLCDCWEVVLRSGCCHWRSTPAVAAMSIHASAVHLLINERFATQITLDVLWWLAMMLVTIWVLAVSLEHLFLLQAVLTVWSHKEIASQQQQKLVMSCVKQIY